MNPDGRHTTKAVSSESSPPSASDDPSGGSKAVGRVLVAGNLTYLSDAERKRAVAPRFGAAHENAPDAWIGTEDVERLALPTGGTQFELLSPSARGSTVIGRRLASRWESIYLDSKKDI